MPKYAFVVEATVSFGTVVEAESLSEAIEEAKTRPTMSIPVNVEDQDTQWVTGVDCNACEGDLVDFHEGDGETFEEVDFAWEQAGHDDAKILSSWEEK